MNLYHINMYIDDQILFKHTTVLNFSFFFKPIHFRKKCKKKKETIP